MMARDAIKIISASPAGVELTAQTVVSATNGAKVAAGVDGKVVLVIASATGEEVNATLKAGVGQNSGIGDLVLPVVAGAKTFIVGPFESERFEQADGNFYIDFETGDVGTIAAIVVP